jgi:transposase-like protein
VGIRRGREGRWRTSGSWVPSRSVENTCRRSRATTLDAARIAYAAFERARAKRCPGVVASSREGGEERRTFFAFPKAQWKTLRTTNTIERLHGEFRRCVKTQGSLPGEDTALILLFSLLASGQIKLRRIDGWRKIAGVLSQNRPAARS